MAFDWTKVDVDAMPRRTISMEEGRSGGLWRQGNEGETCGLEVWLREQAEWGFDSLMLAVDAEAWLGQMESGHLVLIKGRVFERAECGLENEAGHQHTRYCAGPPAAMRAAQRKAVRAVRRAS